MNIKKEILRAAAPPPPKDKDGFLKSLPFPKLSYAEFILVQIGYIRKRMWAVSAAVLLSGAVAACIVSDNKIIILWVISAVVPFLAVFTSAEISRSDIFGMSEIEAGCRFALPQLTGARMIILGVCDFIVISAVIVISGAFSPMGIVRSALYIFAPFVLVCGISLAVFGNVKGQDGVYLSGAAALAVSLAGIILFSPDSHSVIFMNTVNLSVCIVGTAVTALQLRKLLMGKDNCYGIKN